MVTNRMTLDLLRALSRTGDWAAAPGANINWAVVQGQGTEEDIGFESSELTKTSTIERKRRY